MLRRGLLFSLGCLFAAASYGDCIPQVWDGRPSSTGSRALQAAVTTLADGECVVVDARGFSKLTIVTDPTSFATATLEIELNASDADVVVLGSKTYTFESGDLDADGEVELGADAETSLANLVAAVNLAAGAGTLYAEETTAGDATAGEPSNDDAPTGTLTGETIADTNTVTIGAQVYTFQDTLTEADCNVKVGASDSISLDNLIAAINGAAGSGTLYAAACTPHPDVTAAAGDGDTMVATANVAGANGNAIATTHTITGGDWGGPTLEEGSTSVLFTAAVAGTGGNDLASTTDASNWNFDEATFDGATSDPVATISRVDSITATEHTSPPSEVTDTEPALEVFEVDWPFYLISCEGQCRVAVAQ